MIIQTYYVIKQGKLYYKGGMHTLDRTKATKFIDVFEAFAIKNMFGGEVVKTEINETILTEKDLKKYVKEI